MRIDVTVVDTVPLGVDTPTDLERARRLRKAALGRVLVSRRKWQVGFSSNCKSGLWTASI